MAGHITFLLTDVEGSTRLWEREPEAMARALVRHDAVMAEVVEGFGGSVVKPRGEGDSIFSIFDDPIAAVSAALAIQQRLPAEPWETSRPITVRIAVHTGPAEARDGDWYGPTVNRCARLRGAGHGGQVLVSEAVHAAVVDALPGGCTLRDLGPRRLKDLSEPERVYQLEHPTIPSVFPPLLTLDARQHNLPVQPTELLGRDTDTRTVRSLIAGDARLVTLTGPGGVGKTRLALQVAAELVDDFEHGVWFVGLSALEDPNLVPGAIASALGIAEQPGRPVLDAVVDAVRERELLLVLDNFEHVVDAALAVSTILEASARVVVLVTSREWLNLRAERTYEVAPLAIDAAVDLFARRASTADPTFAVGTANRDAVAQLCANLDFLPLAIELVGARVRSATLDGLLAEFPLNVADAGPRDLPARQRTLRHAIAWSYELLDETDQALLRALGTFAGGCDPDAFAAVAGQSATIEALAAKSLALLTHDDVVGIRYSTLVSVRDFAREMAVAVGEHETLAERHARWFDEFAAHADEQLTGPDQRTWLARLEADHPNLRFALAWSEHDPDLGLRLAGNLGRFWLARGHWYEARQWYDVVLGRGGGGAARAGALLGAGYLAGRQGDLDTATALLQESADRADGAGDERAAARAFLVLGELLAGRDPDHARHCCDEARRRFEAAGDDRGRAIALANLGRIERYLGQLDAAAAHFDEALALAEKLGDIRTRAAFTAMLGDVALRGRRHADAQRYAFGALTLHRELGDQYGIASDLILLGAAHIELQEFDEAERAFDEAEPLCRELGDQRGLMNVLQNQAILADARGDLLGACAKHAAAAVAARTVGDAGVESKALQSFVNVAAGLEWPADGLSAQSAWADATKRCEPQTMRAVIDAVAAAGRDRLVVLAQLVAVAAPTGAAKLLGATGDPTTRDGALAAKLRSNLGGTHFNEAWEAGATFSVDQLPELAADITSAS